MTPLVGQRRDDYDDESDFRTDILEAGMTVGRLLTLLERCGVRPRDLAESLGLPPSDDPPWADGRAPIQNEAVALIAYVDGVRTDIRDRSVAERRHARRRVHFTVHRSDREAVRAFAADDALQRLKPDRHVPALASIHRIAVTEAVDRLHDHGVFATMSFDDDPMPDGF